MAFEFCTLTMRFVFGHGCDHPGYVNSSCFVLHSSSISVTVTRNNAVSLSDDLCVGGYSKAKGQEQIQPGMVALPRLALGWQAGGQFTRKYFRHPLCHRVPRSLFVAKQPQAHCRARNFHGLHLHSLGKLQHGLVQLHDPLRPMGSLRLNVGQHERVWRNAG